MVPVILISVIVLLLFVAWYCRGTMRGMVLQVDQWENLSPRGKRIMKVLGWLGVLNLLSFMMVAACLGGDAFNGEAVKGHYYFIEKGTGVRTEVTPGVWRYSRIHAASAMATTVGHSSSGESCV